MKMASFCLASTTFPGHLVSFLFNLSQNEKETYGPGKEATNSCLITFYNYICLQLQCYSTQELNAL